MDNLNESKQEKLPVDFLTQFISRGWDEVGNLNASMDGIKKEFKDTKKAVDILQALADAYLIAIGQMEALLENKNYLEFPEEEKLEEKLVEELVVEQTEDLEVTDNNIAVEEDDLAEETLPAPKKSNAENFEYFVDFDDPEPDAEADAEIANWIRNH